MAGPFRPCRDHRAADEETTAAPTTRGKTTGPDGAFRGGRPGTLGGAAPAPDTTEPWTRGMSHTEADATAAK